MLYFGFLIFSHELGHFSAARAFKVRVTEFSMGMGPRILKKQKGETLYSLKAIPFGGSVLMEEDEGPSEDPRAFVNQKPWKRFTILFAGALVNIVVGTLIMGCIVGMSPSLEAPRVGVFREEAVSADYGLQAGDTIVKVDGRRVFSGMDLRFLFPRSKTGLVNLVVKRGGETVKLDKLKLLQYNDGNGGEAFYFFDFHLQDYARKTPGVFLSETLGRSASVVRMVWLSLLDMVTGKFSFRELSGPIGVVSVITESTQEVQQSAPGEAALYSLLNLMFLLALISINIGVMNLLPLPALDGGRLFFCVVEMIFRKPIPKKLEAWVHGVGIVLLMGFMIVICFSDIWGLIKR